jgi:hypothetical protein
VTAQELHERETILAFYRTNESGWLWPEAAWWTPGQPIDLLPTEAQMAERWAALDAAALAEFGVDAMARFRAACDAGEDEGVSDWMYQSGCSSAYWTRECMVLFLEAFPPAETLVLKSADVGRDAADAADDWLRGQRGRPAP